jgi:hypothetical protein
VLSPGASGTGACFDAWLCGLALMWAQSERASTFDSPRSCAPESRAARDGGLQLVRSICGIGWTPGAGRVQASAYYAWVLEGCALFDALAARGVEVIEVFPTASWTRWQEKRGPRSLAAWTRQGLGTLGLIGSGASSAITSTLVAVLVVIACTISLAVLGGIAWLVYRVRQITQDGRSPPGRCTKLPPERGRAWRPRSVRPSRRPVTRCICTSTARTQPRWPRPYGTQPRRGNHGTMVRVTHSPARSAPVKAPAAGCP